MSKKLKLTLKKIMSSFLALLLIPNIVVSATSGNGMHGENTQGNTSGGSSVTNSNAGFYRNGQGAYISAR